MLCAVAGCLFEVHLSRPADHDHWAWAGAEGAAVTLLHEHLSGEPPDCCRFRFRAEEPGDATLTFRVGTGAPAERLHVHIAPEVVDG